MGRLMLLSILCGKFGLKVRPATRRQPITRMKPVNRRQCYYIFDSAIPRVCAAGHVDRSGLDGKGLSIKPAGNGLTRIWLISREAHRH
jgi:hypothetical protein